MAIDDNTSYELTGAQVKDLANKIKAKAADNIFVGATSAAPGSKGLVPQPQAGDDTKFLSGDGTWKTASSGPSYTAGTGIDITGTTLSVDTSVIAELSDLPTKTSDLTNDGADGTSTYVEADELATVATSGSYTDLTNKPTIPAAQVNSDWNAASGVAQILNKPSLATVATTGDYDDLIDKPTIPTVNDATLTITQNGTSVGAFTANASSDATIALTDTTYTAGNGIDITNDEISVDTSVVATQTDLGNYVTLGTNQNITGEKTFVGNKRIKFKGTASNSKCGFTSFDQNNGETGFLEVEGVSTASKKVRLGCYDNAGGNARDNYVGFQYYNTKPVGGGTVSYNLVCPPQYRGISGTNSFAYIPVDFTDGTTTVRAGVDGVLDLSSLIPAAPTVNDATLTIQHNGTNVQTFTANSSTNKTANIETIYADDAIDTSAIGAASYFAQVTTSTPIASSATKVLEVASVPAGKYLVVAQLEIRGTASNNVIEGNGYIYENGVEVIGQFGSVYSGVNRLGISLATTINHATAGSIALYARGSVGSNWYSDGRTTLNIVRVN